jgi:hypothetical protein
MKKHAIFIIIIICLVIIALAIAAMQIDKIGRDLVQDLENATNSSSAEEIYAQKYCENTTTEWRVAESVESTFKIGNENETLTGYIIQSEDGIRFEVYYVQYYYNPASFIYYLQSPPRNESYGEYYENNKWLRDIRQETSQSRLDLGYDDWLFPIIKSDRYIYYGAIQDQYDGEYVVEKLMRCGVTRERWLQGGVGYCPIYVLEHLKSDSLCGEGAFYHG